ncbi:Protein of unknown function [Pyronema omphalodes CBS 100304]|uniref:Uncharacterized protein n=1 Tax=Pyronema omphalodes (strain CBS 100304) TaxID=1076935 RepID=U4LAE6_PYROM|nr:Protein of unknown function [Pyronema omphalodes CBS 100304]
MINTCCRCCAWILRLCRRPRPPKPTMQILHWYLNQQRSGHATGHPRASPHMQATAPGVEDGGCRYQERLVKGVPSEPGESAYRSFILAVQSSSSRGRKVHRGESMKAWSAQPSPRGNHGRLFHRPEIATEDSKCRLRMTEINHISAVPFEDPACFCAGWAGHGVSVGSHGVSNDGKLRLSRTRPVGTVSRPSLTPP